MAGAAGFNGIRTHGANNMDRLDGPLETLGTPYYDISIRKRRVWNSNWRTARWDARHALQQFEGRPITKGAAHSRGASVLCEVAKVHEFETLVFIGAALRRHYDFGQLKGSPTIINCFSRSDGWVRLGGRVPLHLFGHAGWRGMTFPGVINVEFEGGHNAYFQGDQLQDIARLIHDPFPVLADIQALDDRRIWFAD